MVQRTRPVSQANGWAASRRSLRMVISSAGRRVELLRRFRQSAEILNVDLEIIACDLNPEWSAACIMADKAFAVPPAGSDTFIPMMLDICERENVDLIVPTIDTELIAYSHARKSFEAMNCWVAVSDEDLVVMARDKMATARFLEAAQVRSPKTALLRDFLDNRTGLRFPLLAKPRHGSSSRGIALVHDKSQLAMIDAVEPYIVQQFLPGREFTVSVYFDDGGKLQCALPHERLRVRSGEVEKGVTIRDEMLADIAWKLADHLVGARGAMCFQARLDESGSPSVFELNARFGGGYPLAHQAGAKFAKWILEERLGLPSTANDDWKADVLMLRFDDAVFI